MKNANVEVYQVLAALQLLIVSIKCAQSARFNVYLQLPFAKAKIRPVLNVLRRRIASK
jgi:hypothetical protein